jgi:hypothetical protein
MDDHNVILADPWLKNADKATSLPDDARFACAYQLYVVVESFDETAYFRRTKTTDELWIGTGEYSPTRDGVTDGTTSPQYFERAKLTHIGCVFAVPRKGEELFACLNLLELLFRARYGFYSPDGFVASGIVDKSAFDSLVGRIEHELKENRQEAREGETEIIKVARELGLSPQPTGHGSSHWAARCPEMNHQLFIDAAENSFGCGYCKRKGTVEELRAFVKERTERRTSLSSQSANARG